MKKNKEKKIPIIKRRILRLWSELILTRSNFTCEVCGIKKGEINKNGKSIILNAHHIINKEHSKDSFLKYHPLNGIALCPSCHKFGENAAHKNLIFFADFLQKNKKEQYQFLLDNHKTRINLNDRSMLQYLESILENEINKLKGV